MIRFMSRLLALVSLSVAVIMAVRDASRSIAISRVDPTPLGGTWFEYAPTSLESLRQFLQTSGAAFVWDPVMLFLLKMPGFLVFAVFAVILFAIGHRPERPAGRFAA